MLIANSLRQECMPKMIYALVKLVKSDKYSEIELRKTLTASICSEYDDNSKDLFSKVLSFSIESGMVNEDQGYYTTTFDLEEIKSFSNFTYSLLGKLSSQTKDNMFNSLLKIYLNQNNIFENEFTDTAAKFREKVLNEALIKPFNISEDNIHGFFFWAEALGIANFEKDKSGHLYYSIENVLLKYLKNHKELRQGGYFTAKEFFNELGKELFFIPFCIDENINLISYPMSQALRILENMELISIDYRQDSEEKWHLTQSEIFNSGNTFTNVGVC